LPIKEQTKLSEGFNPKVYYDSRGFKTIGYGFNLDQSGAK
jgi:GH24 family phage-related lysozyme (muramidase)